MIAIKVIVKNFLEFFLSRVPWVYAHILKYKRNNNSEKILFLKLLRNKDSIIDVGANQGRNTILFSHIVGKNGQVYAFEPIPATFALLSEHMSCNKFLDNVQLINAAVGNQDGEISLYLPNDDTEQASLIKHDAGSWMGTPRLTSFLCQMTTLDSFAMEESLDSLDFIKIDVEGAELLALQGATTIINKFKPLIYLEVNPLWIKDFGYKPADLFSLLMSLGYTDFFVSDNKLKRLSNPISEYATGCYSDSNNILCVIDTWHKKRICTLVSLG